MVVGRELEDSAGGGRYALERGLQMLDAGPNVDAADDEYGDAVDSTA